MARSQELILVGLMPFSRSSMILRLYSASVSQRRKWLKASLYQIRVLGVTFWRYRLASTKSWTGGKVGCSKR
jgi:hypothetical protein